MLRSPLIATCAALALSMAGCGSCSDNNSKDQGKAANKPAKPSDPPDVVAIKQVADEMCGCSHNPCADKVLKRFNKFEAEHHATAATRSAHRKAIRRLMACYTRIARPGGTPVDPAAARIVRIARSFGKLADTACACTDVTCAGEAVARMRELDARFARTRPDAQTRRSIDEHRRRSTECMKKLAKGKSVARIAFEASLAKLRDVAKFACSCKGAACRRKVSVRLMHWRKVFRGIEPGPQEQKLITEQQKKMRSCLPRAKKKN